MEDKSDKHDFTKSTSFKFIDAQRVQNPLKLRAFIEWLVLPGAMRRPKTQKDFATKIGVNQDTLTDWKKLDGFWKEVQEEQQYHFKTQTSEVLYGLTKKAKEGNPAAVKLYLQYFCGFSEKQTVREESNRELNDDQKKEIQASLKRWGLMNGGEIDTKRCKKVQTQV